MSKENNKFISTNFSGGIKLNASPVGVLANSKKIYWDDSFNVEIYKNFGVATSKGNVEIAKNQDGDGIFGITSVQNNSSDFLFLTESGKLCYFSDDLGTISELKTLNTRPERFSAIKFLNGVLILTGTNRIQFVKMSPQVEISEIKIVGVDGGEVYGKCLAQYASRVWVSDGSTLYFSSLGTCDNWDEAQNAGYISNFHTSNSEIVAMTDYAGKLAIYKTDGVYLLTGSSVDDFAINKLGNLGVIATGAVVNANNKQFFMNNSGVYALEQFGELAQIALNTTISENIQTEFLNFDIKKANLASALNNFEKNQIWFFTPNKHAEGISEVLIYDYLNSSWAKRRIPFDIRACANVGGKILTGSQDGRIFVENVGNTFSGKPIEFRFSTPFFHFGEPNKRKIIGEANLILDENFQNAFKFGVCKNFKKDAETDIEYTKTISPKTLVFAGFDDNGGKYSSCWAEDENAGFCWAEPFEEGLRVEVFDSCTSFQLNLSSNTIGDGFGLVGVEFSEVYFD